MRPGPAEDKDKEVKETFEALLLSLPTSPSPRILDILCICFTFETSLLHAPVMKVAVKPGLRLRNLSPSNTFILFQLAEKELFFSTVQAMSGKQQEQQ